MGRQRRAILRRRTPQGTGVVVLHAWWGLTEPFRQACDRLQRRASWRSPRTSIVARRPQIEEAEMLATALDQNGAV